MQGMPWCVGYIIFRVGSMGKRIVLGIASCDQLILGIASCGLFVLTFDGKHAIHRAMRPTAGLGVQAEGPAIEPLSLLGKKVEC
jgi:hypothetical protein